MRSLTSFRPKWSWSKNLAGIGDVQIVWSNDRPGQVDQPIQVGADDAILSGSGRQAAEPVQLAARHFLGFFRHGRGFDLLAEFIHLGRLFVGLPQLSLDGFELFA